MENEKIHVPTPTPSMSTGTHTHPPRLTPGKCSVKAMASLTWYLLGMSKACQSEPPPMDRVSILVQTEADGAEEHTTAAPYYESPWTFTENMKEDNTGQTCAGNSTEEKGPR